VLNDTSWAVFDEYEARQIELVTLEHGVVLGALHTLAEGREAIDFHQSNCKNPRV
jgi:hypothetical protein